MQTVHAQISGLETPFVVAQSGRDRIVSQKGAFDLMAEAKSSEKSLVFV